MGRLDTVEKIVCAATIATAFLAPAFAFLTPQKQFHKQPKVVSTVQHPQEKYTIPVITRKVPAEHTPKKYSEPLEERTEHAPEQKKEKPFELSYDGQTLWNKICANTYQKTEELSIVDVIKLCREASWGPESIRLQLGNDILRFLQNQKDFPTQRNILLIDSYHLLMGNTPAYEDLKQRYLQELSFEIEQITNNDDGGAFMKASDWTYMLFDNGTADGDEFAIIRTKTVDDLIKTNPELVRALIAHAEKHSKTNYDLEQKAIEHELSTGETREADSGIPPYVNILQECEKDLQRLATYSLATGDSR